MAKIRSVWWSHYDKKDKDVVICKYCSKSLKYCGNTTNLRSHYERMHLPFLSAFKLTMLPSSEEVVEEDDPDSQYDVINITPEIMENEIKREVESDTESINVNNIESNGFHEHSRVKEKFIYINPAKKSKGRFSPQIKMHQDFIPLKTNQSEEAHKNVKSLISSSKSNDELEAFTELLMHRLKKLESKNPKKVCIIKHQFEDILFKAEMEMYDNVESDPSQSTSESLNL